MADPTLRRAAAPATPTRPAGPAHSRLRRLPAIDKVRSHPLLRSVIGLGLGNDLPTTLAREAVAALRAELLAAKSDEAAAALDVEARLAAHLRSRCEALRGPILRRLHNGMGVLLLTNAGRAPLGPAAIQAIADTCAGYSNLELDLDDGSRGSRQALLQPLLRWLSGAEAALVVNNGAAALLLALHALAAGRPVVVSRGELVEIGGSFRVPEVMAAAGVRLHEVGTTNRTHAADYQRAIEALRGAGDPPALLLQVHRSNFDQVGFVATPAVAELAAIATAQAVPLVCDLGSGAVADLSAHGLRHEPVLRDALLAGADLVTASGDKLLGGPQAGLLLGRDALVQRCARSPMSRALRPCRLTLAALEPTLRAHLLDQTTQDLPLWRAITRSVESLSALGARLVATTGEVVDSSPGLDLSADLVVSEAAIGGGSQAGATLPSLALRLLPRNGSASALGSALRALPTPWLGRVRADAVLLDLRSLACGAAGDDESLAAAWADALWALGRASTTASAVGRATNPSVVDHAE